MEALWQSVTTWKFVIIIITLRSWWGQGGWAGIIVLLSRWCIVRAPAYSGLAVFARWEILQGKQEIKILVKIGEWQWHRQIKRSRIIADGHHYLYYLHFFFQFFLAVFHFGLRCPWSWSKESKVCVLRTFLRKSARAQCQNDMLEVVICGVEVRPPRPDNGHNGCLESPGWPHHATSPHTPGRLRGDIPRVHRWGQETLHQRNGVHH